MDINLPLLIGFGAMLVIGVIVGLKLNRSPISAFEREVETDLFKAAEKAIEKLADTSAEDRLIQAAQKRREMKATLLKQALANLEARQ